VAHRRKPLTVALGLNTVVLVVEVAGGIQASSLSLVIDGVHNLSDEVALGFLVLAYAMRTGLSSRLPTSSLRCTGASDPGRSSSSIWLE